MIQPIGKGENSINSIFDFDWEKHASEVKEINQKHNTVTPQRCNISKQTAGSMYAMQNQHRVELPFDSQGIDPEPDKVAQEKINHESNRKLERAFNPEQSPYLQNGMSVSSVEHTAGQGGNSKYIKSESSNSIWDDNKLGRLAEVMDSRTKMQEEKLANREARMTMREQSHNDLAEALHGVDQRKSANVSSLSESQGNDAAHFMSTAGNMSLFDFMGERSKNDFERLEEKTAGEKLSESKAQRKAEVAEDESWKSSGKALSSQSITDRLFDALSEQRGE